MTLSKRQQIKASKIVDKWEGITGVDAINARQATLIDQLDELDPTKFDD